MRKSCGVVCFCAAAVVLLAAGRARAVEFEKRWEGNLGGESRFYSPEVMAAGDFAKDHGQEILVLDTDGYAYFLAWKNNGLRNIWITSERVTAKRIASVTAGDFDGDGEDEAALVNREGKVLLLGGDRKKFRLVCDDCVPREFKGFKAEFASPCRVGKNGQAELLLEGKWNGKRTALELKMKGKSFTASKAIPLEAKGEVMSLMAANEPARNRFYMHIYLGRAGDAAQPFYLDEEGAQVEAPVDLKGSKLDVAMVFAADTDGDHKTELYILGSTGKGIKSHRAVVEFNPGGTPAFKPMPGAKADASFLAAPDLNGDGIPELVFGDYEGKAAVYSMAVPSLMVNGKVKPGGDAMRIKQGKAYIAPQVLAGFKTVKDGNLVVISGGGRTLALDVKRLKSTLRSPGEEESVVGSVPFITAGAGVFLEAEAAARALGFTAVWDSLALALRLKF